MYFHLQYTECRVVLFQKPRIRRCSGMNKSQSHVHRSSSYPAAMSRIRGSASYGDAKFSRSRLTRDSAKKCIRTLMRRGNCIQRTSREFISAKRGWHIGIVLVVWPHLCTLSARQLSAPNGIVLLVLSLSSFFLLKRLNFWQLGQFLNPQLFKNIIFFSIFIRLYWEKILKNQSKCKILIH